MKAETLHVSVGDVFATLAGYLGSSYVNQFNKFGRTFQVYVQADSQFRLRPRDIENLTVRNQQGNMIPLGTLVTIDADRRAVADQPLQSVSVRDVIGLPAAGLQLRRGDAPDGGDRRARRCRRAPAIEWTAMSYQEKIVGNQIYLVFGLALLLVYLCSPASTKAGSRRSR